MAEQNETNKSDKAEDTVKRRPRKPIAYKRFEKLLRRVIKAPPLRKTTDST